MDRMHERNAKAPPAARGAPALPRSSQLPLDLLPAFDAVARHLSITEAAHELALTQSAVSRQILQLEARLGVALFTRGHRSLALTDAGHVMLRATQDSLARLHEAAARVRPQAAGRQLTLTCTPGFASFWLIPRLARFTARHPEVDVRVSATLDLLDLERRQVDLAVRFVPSAQGEGPMLFEEEVLPMCGPQLLRDRSRPLRRPADLRLHTVLTVDLPGQLPTLDWEPWLQLMGIGPIEPARTLRFSQYSEAVAAAVAGHGLVIGRLPLLQSLLDEGRLVMPFRSPAASRRGYFVQLAAHAAANPLARAFVDWLQEEARAEPPAAKPQRRGGTGVTARPRRSGSP